MFVLKNWAVLFSVLVVLFIGSTETFSAEVNPQVRIIYFVPKDRIVQWDIRAKINSEIKEVQSVFSDQLSSYGYGEKTFELQTDADGKVIVHLVVGESEDMYYQDDTHRKIVSEAESSFDTEKHVYLIVADLSYELIDGGCGIATLNGGPITIPASGDCVQDGRGVYVIAHELGHAFNLRHDYRDSRYIMSQALDMRGNFSECAAAILNVNPFLNSGGLSVNTLGRIEMLTPTTYINDKEDFSVEFNVSDVDGLYLVEFSSAFEHREITVKECKKIDGLQTAKVKFDMPQDAASVSYNNIRIRLFDQNGYITELTETLRLEGDIKPEDDIQKSDDFMYLTLFYDSPDALKPINPQFEWNGWVYLNPMWERIPGSAPPKKPAYYIDFPHQNTWEHWFYAHAAAKYVYDVSDKNYIRFETLFYFANSCADSEDDPTVASVELVLYADDVKIYNSGVLFGKLRDEDNKHEISVDIPTDTEELIVVVSEATRGNFCDHFVLANSKLFYETSSERPDTEADVNNDGIVNVVDLVLVAARYGERITGDPFPNPDVNGDGIVDIKDIVLITEDMPEAQGTPSISNKGFEYQQAYDTLPIDVVNKGIATLDGLFRVDTPIKTLLLNNYPNPFNPETWIPYQLSETADVVLTIYAANGNVVRKLDIGQQTPGYYLTRDRAAYWNGKNTVGEKVSSGVYFYRLEASNFSSIRKMIILK